MMQIISPPSQGQLQVSTFLWSSSCLDLTTVSVNDQSAWKKEDKQGAKSRTIWWFLNRPIWTHHFLRITLTFMAAQRSAKPQIRRKKKEHIPHIPCFVFCAVAVSAPLALAASCLHQTPKWRHLHKKGSSAICCIKIQKTKRLTVHNLVQGIEICHQLSAVALMQQPFFGKPFGTSTPRSCSGVRGLKNGQFPKLALSVPNLWQNKDLYIT